MASQACSNEGDIDLAILMDAMPLPAIAGPTILNQDGGADVTPIINGTEMSPGVVPSPEIGRGIAWPQFVKSAVSAGISSNTATSDTKGIAISVPHSTTTSNLVNLCHNGLSQVSSPATQQADNEVDMSESITSSLLLQANDGPTTINGQIGSDGKTPSFKHRPKPVRGRGLGWPKRVVPEGTSNKTANSDSKGAGDAETYRNERRRRRLDVIQIQRPSANVSAVENTVSASNEDQALTGADISQFNEAQAASLSNLKPASTLNLANSSAFTPKVALVVFSTSIKPSDAPTPVKTSVLKSKHVSAPHNATVKAAIGHDAKEVFQEVYTNNCLSRLVNAYVSNTITAPTTVTVSNSKATSIPNSIVRPCSSSNHQPIAATAHAVGERCHHYNDRESFAQLNAKLDIMQQNILRLGTIIEQQVAPDNLKQTRIISSVHEECTQAPQPTINSQGTQVTPWKEVPVKATTIYCETCTQTEPEDTIEPQIFGDEPKQTSQSDNEGWSTENDDDVGNYLRGYVMSRRILGEGGFGQVIAATRKSDKKKV